MKPPKSRRIDQLDLFGQTREEPRKRKAIKLKPLPTDRVAVPGMASFAGEGPPGMYCQDCHWFGSVVVTRPDYDTTEHASEACALWAKRMGHAVPIGHRRGIRHCASCKHFRAAEEAVRAFRIDPEGNLKEQ